MAVSTVIALCDAILNEVAARGWDCDGEAVWQEDGRPCVIFSVNIGLP